MITTNTPPKQQAIEHTISTNGTPGNSRKRKNKSITCEEVESISKKDGLKDLNAAKSQSMVIDSCAGISNIDGSCQMDESTSVEDRSRVNESSDEEEEGLMKFNEDLLCEHGKLCQWK